MELECDFGEYNWQATGDEAVDRSSDNTRRHKYIRRPSQSLSLEMLLANQTQSFRNHFCGGPRRTPRNFPIQR